MEKLATRDPEPIKYFLEPVDLALNNAAKDYNTDDVVMIGLSGGGWTSTLYAAVDPRIRLRFPVAGTLPDYLRVGRPGDKGDWEQYYPPRYRIANYPDLYVLGSSGKGRRQRQVLNEYDTCCFWGVGYRTYEKHVAKAVADFGPGGLRRVSRRVSPVPPRLARCADEGDRSAVEGPPPEVIRDMLIRGETQFRLEVPS